MIMTITMSVSVTVSISISMTMSMGITVRISITISVWVSENQTPCSSDWVMSLRPWKPDSLISYDLWVMIQWLVTLLVVFRFSSAQ